MGLTQSQGIKFMVVAIRVSVVMAGLCFMPMASAAVVTFFNSAQEFTNRVSGSTSDTVQCGNYLFTHSLDKWWYPTISLGGGTPTGRYLRVELPEGLEAQAVTAGPSGLVTNQAKAKITISRVDGEAFDITAFTARLLANTAGAGGAFEIMPKIQGEDGLPDPVMFNASGYAGSTFSYQTPTLSGFDSYDLTLYVDFALTTLTIADTSPVSPPRLRYRLGSSGARDLTLFWSAEATGYHLQASPDVIGNTFTNVSTAPLVQDGCYWVTVPASEPRAFFRLAN